MSSFYDEIELVDFDFDLDINTYYYPCPCGDRFQITVEEIEDGEEIARCPSCSLMLRVIYDRDQDSKINHSMPLAIKV